MSYTAEAYNVMIASPGDVAAEREIIRKVIDEWNAINAEAKGIILMPLGWETHATPELGGRAQALINEQVLDRCDLLVAVFWTRLGTATGVAPSGTVEEINRHVDRGRAAMVYFSNAPVHPDSIDEDQFRAVRNFRDECQRRGLYEAYDDLGDFRTKFNRQLSQLVIRRFSTERDEGQSVGVPIPIPTRPIREAPALSQEAAELLSEAAADPNGTVLRVRTMSGTTVQTNGKVLNEQGNPRSEAVWEHAIQELVEAGLLESRGYKGEVFSVTHSGYELADALPRTRGRNGA